MSNYAVTFETKLKYFEAEEDTEIVPCYQCGDDVEVRKGHRHTLCPNCQKQHENEKASLRYKEKMDFSFGELNLVYAMVSEAIQAAKKGDNEALQWLKDDAGLWFKAIGVGVTQSLIDNLVAMGEGKLKFSPRNIYGIKKNFNPPYKN